MSSSFASLAGIWTPWARHIVRLSQGSSRPQLQRTSFIFTDSGRAMSTISPCVLRRVSRTAPTPLMTLSTRLPLWAIFSQANSRLRYGSSPVSWKTSRGLT